MNSEYGFMFSKPVDPEEFGLYDYFDVIETPIDLNLVSEKLENKAYKGLKDFVDDVHLVFDNAVLYGLLRDDLDCENYRFVYLAKKMREWFDIDLQETFARLTPQQLTLLLKVAPRTFTPDNTTGTEEEKVPF
jgi:hypothetical protein